MEWECTVIIIMMIQKYANVVSFKRYGSKCCSLNEIILYVNNPPCDVEIYIYIYMYNFLLRQNNNNRDTSPLGPVEGGLWMKDSDPFNHTASQN